MNDLSFYPIGKPGQAWGAAEVAAWRSRAVRQRSYATDVLSVIDSLRQDFDVSDYGTLTYDGEQFPLRALRSREWRPELPTVVVTGGVHGYETSGVLGALQFLRDHGLETTGRANLIAVPCVSPWAWE
ncbi:MAG: peptidase, partial [Rubrivivax sp.]